MNQYFVSIYDMVHFKQYVSYSDDENIGYVGITYLKRGGYEYITILWTRICETIESYTHKEFEDQYI